MTYFLGFATSAVVTLVAGAAVRRAAIRYGAVVPLRPDRWHRHPTPTFGGLAFFVGLLAGIATVLPLWLGELPLGAAVLGVGGALFAIGWYDDIRPFSAVAKIVSSLSAAAFFVFALAYLVPSLRPGPTSAALSLMAILAFAFLDNAVNLLDNMDGLAAGVIAIAALGLALTFPEALGQTLTLTLVSLAGALVGFLAWNRHPARLFMGNCGSLAIGGLLAACALVAIVRSGSPKAVVATVLILFTPIIDSTFVILLRWMAGRSTTAGFIDHISHRLVAAGSSEVRSVLILYALTAAGAGAGFLLQTEGLRTWPFAAMVVTAAVILTLYLARVPAYSGQDFVALQGKPLALLLTDLTVRWHAGEVLLDLVLIAICYYTAYYLRFEGQALAAFLWSYRASLPLFLGCQIGGLYASGLYERAWSTFGFQDLWAVVRGVGLGSMLAVLLIAGVYKNTREFELFSRAVFIIDALLLMTAIMVSRLSFRILKGMAADASATKRRVMIYGAGVRGQLLVREMLANPAWLRNPVAFIDDDPLKQGRRLLGVPVRGSIDSLPEILTTLSVDEVLLSSPSINGTNEARVREVCGSQAVPVRRLHLELR